MIVPILLLCAASFVISWLLTFAVKRVAPKFDFVDKPGGRKTHANPKALGGGIAIFWGFALPMLCGILLARPAFMPGNLDPHYQEALASGVSKQTPLALTLLGVVFGVHVLGLIDDRKALGPFIKLFFQLACAAALVIPFKMFILTALDARLGMHGV